MTFDFEEIKKHPYLIGGAIVGGALFLYLILHRGSSSGGTASSGIDPTLASLYGEQAQASAQQSQLNAQLQGAQLSANTTTTANQLTAGVDLAQIAAQENVSNLSTTTTGDVQETQLADQLQANHDTLTAQLGAAADQLLGLENTNQTQTNIAQINAGQNVDIAQLTNQTAQTYINAETNAMENASNNNAAITITALKGAGGGGVLGGIGAFAGLAAAFI